LGDSGVEESADLSWCPRFVGVVHVPAMPGDPCYVDGGFAQVESFAMRDVDALVAGGVEGLIVENFGSAPFFKGDATSRIPPHQVAFLAHLSARIKRETQLFVGVNCLRNDARSAMGIAAAVDLDFIRINVHTGAYLTDQGIIEGEAAQTLRYRSSLGASHVRILADVLVKHAAPLAPLDPSTVVDDTVKRGLADALVVTGSATGAEIDEGRLRVVRHASKGAPVLLGSGVTPENAARCMAWADGAIVGTWLKVDGDVANPVDPSRVALVAAALRG
jgi:uncharacterized protein